MSPEQTRSRCSATTREGQPCKNLALPDSQFCRVHQPVREGQAPGSIPSVQPEVRTSPAQEAEPVPTLEEVERLAGQLEEMIARLRAARPEYAEPEPSVRGLFGLLAQNLKQLAPEREPELLRRLRKTLKEDVLNIETWKGFWFIVNYMVQNQREQLGRRLKGDYETDDWGMDPGVLEAVRPVLTFLFKHYWRVETTGIEHIPDEGRALLVANHSGQLPWDGAMIGTAVYLQHPSQRLVRTLFANWFPTLPFLSALFVKLGQTVATVDNGTRLLEEDQLVAVFPEGYKGSGKLFRERYRLARFGRGGFVKMALRTGAPIIPVAVVGAEETYLSLHKSETLARLIGLPYFPITPTWPWLGPLGLVPAPSKWYIDFGEPIPMDGYGPQAAEDLLLVSQLTDLVRNTVQEMIYRRLEQRRSVFLG